MGETKTKIVGWEDSSFKDGEIVVDEVSVTYTQNPDCTEDGESQTLVISSRNNGESRFINISTQNWSVDDANEMKRLMDDFCKRASIKKKD